MIHQLVWYAYFIFYNDGLIACLEFCAIRYHSLGATQLRSYKDVKVIVD